MIQKIFLVGKSNNYFRKKPINKPSEIVENPNSSTIFSNVPKTLSQQTLPNQPQSKKPELLFSYFICVLIAIPQLVTQTYSAYFKLDGFNDSLNDLNSLGPIKFPTMCEWVIGLLVGIYLLQYISYAIIPMFEEDAKNEGKKNDHENSSDNSTTDSILYHVTWKHKLNGTDIFVCSVVLINTSLYGYVSFNASNETFFKQAWCNDHRFAIGLAIVCTIGILFKESTYSMPRAVSTFPHLLNLKLLYWDIIIKPNQNIYVQRFKRISCGFLLIVLAIATIPFSLLVASHSPLPPCLAKASSVIAMLIVYVVSVYGLCGKEINRANVRLDQKKNNKRDKVPEKEKKWSIGHYLGFLFCSVLFAIGCLISAVGTGFSWQKTFSEKTSLSYGYILAIFFGITLLALIGRMQFCNKKKTINDMVNSPYKIKKGFDALSSYFTIDKQTDEGFVDSHLVNQP